MRRKSQAKWYRAIRNRALKKIVAIKGVRAVFSC
jgi:hypothetical protein